jgi:hypothetical protein
MAGDVAKPTVETSTVDEGTIREGTEDTLAHQAGLVELLQTLLFTRQVDLNHRTRRPALVVALSCWDEISDGNETGAPAQFLQNQLPLVSQFITSNWDANAVSVLGLSALGGPLSNDVSDDNFVEGGPERHGWCVGEGVPRSQDLTLPIAKLMQQLAE